MSALTGLISGVAQSKALWTSVGVGLPVLYYLKYKIQKAVFDRNATMVASNLTGKNVLVTGGNSGIGLGTAIEFAKLNANITITARSDEKGQNAVQEINKYYPGNSSPRGVAKYELLDTSNLNSTKAFISRLQSQPNLLIDYLILNAGIASYPSSMPKDAVVTDPEGLNYMFATNHFGHWLITYKLLDVLLNTASTRIRELSPAGGDTYWLQKFGAPVRVVAVSSGAHRDATYGLCDRSLLKQKNPKLSQKELEAALDSDGYFDMVSKGSDSKNCQYSDSKLLNVLHMMQLQKIVNEKGQQDGVWCAAITPGMVRTPIFEKFSGSSVGAKIVMTAVWPLFWFVSRSVTKGVQVILHCCGNNDEEIRTHPFWSNCEKGLSQDSIKRPVLEQAQDAQHLWQRSEQLWVELSPQEATK